MSVDLVIERVSLEIGREVNEEQNDVTCKDSDREIFVWGWGNTTE